MILDGKALSQKIIEEIKLQVPMLDKKPHLAVILVGEDSASKIYVNIKKKTALEIGIDSTIIELAENVDEKTLIEHIEALNNDDSITGILLQMPLPKHINKFNVISKISPKKDVDCFTPENVGKLSIGMDPYYYPVTPQGIIMLLDSYKIPIDGQSVVIIGRSNIVGKPMAQMLIKRNATVTMCHSQTKNLEQIIKTADIVISAVGKKIVRCKMFKYKSVFIDVGISKDTNGKITGDLILSDLNNINDINDFVSAFSPVPGGVGPMTIASLMLNACSIQAFQCPEMLCSI